MTQRVNEGAVVYLRVHPEKGSAVDLPPERVVGFVFEDRSVGVDKLTLEIDNTDFLFFEDPLLIPGNKIEFSFGYPSQLSFKRVAKIKVVRGSLLRLTVEAYGRETDFALERTTKTWKNLSLDEIITQIAQDMGYRKTDVHASSEKRAATQQAGESYAEFLMKWASRLGCEWFVDVDDTFHFHPRDHSQQPVRTFVWRGAKDRSEIVMTPEMDHQVKHKPGAIEAVSVDPKKKKIRRRRATKANTSTPILASSTLIQEDVPFSKKPARLLSLQAWHSEQHVKEYAEAQYRVWQQGQLKIKMPVVGDPTLQAKRIVALENFGVLLSGNWYVVRATHKIGGGSAYFVDLELRRDGVSGGKAVLKRKAPDQGISGPRENREKTPKNKKPIENFLPDNRGKVRG